MSTPSRRITYAFHAGEIAPAAHGRSDVERYNSALDILENWIVTPQGGLSRRMGSHFVNEIKNSARRPRLIRFEFSNVQAYILELGHLYIRFYRDGGRIENPPGTPVEVATPYEEGDIYDVSITQSADVLYLTHPGHQPQKLSRSSHTNWMLSAVTTVDGPYLDKNQDDTFTMTLSDITGTGKTLTASNDIFDPGHVGSIWRIEEASSSKYNEWSSETEYGTNARVINDGRVYQKVASGDETSGKRPPTHKIGTESDGVIDWQWLHDGYGIVKVTGFTDSKHVTVDIIKRCPNSTTAGTLEWREGAWSPFRGWPGCVTFFQNRLAFAATKSRPSTVWLSCSDKYEKFSPTDRGAVVLDTNAISFTIAGNTVSNILWLAAAINLVIGTSSGEWVASAGSTSKAFGPDNLKVDNQSAWGSQDAIPTIRVGTSTLFIQRGGRRLREMLYFYDADSWQASDISILSEHLTQQGGGIVDCSFAPEPYSIWWGVRGDGLLVGCTYIKEQKVIGWHRHSLGGTFQGGPAVVESVCSIPASDGSHDQVWLVVKRTIAGQTKRYIEYLEKPFIPSGPMDSEGMWYVDCGLKYNGTPTSEISNLVHLSGETVDVIGDGTVQPRKTVDDAGEIQIETPASTVVAGLPYQSRLKTLPLESPSQKGSSFGAISRINTIEVQLLDSLGFKYGHGSTTGLQMLTRADGMAMDNRPEFYTGIKQLSLVGSYTRESSISIVQDLPYPCTILSLIFEAVIYERA